MLHCNCACLKGEIKLEVIMAQNEQLYLIKSHTLHKSGYFVEISKMFDDKKSRSKKFTLLCTWLAMLFLVKHYVFYAKSLSEMPGHYCAPITVFI